MSGRLGSSFYSPFSFAESGWRHRRLIVRLARRKIEARYRGSVLGVAWAVIQPLFVLGLYTFVFSVVFGARWTLPQGGETPFSVIFFSGLLLYTLFAECANEAPQLMAAHRTYIKQARFPTEILSWVVLLSSLFNFAIGMVLLAALYVVLLGAPPLTSLYLPLVVAPVLLAALGMTWILSSLGVFLRDISQLVAVLTLALLFLSPVFYSVSVVPDGIRPYYQANPLAWVLEMARGLLFFGTAPDWIVWGVLMISGWLMAWLGYLWFMRTKKAFADVL